MRGSKCYKVFGVQEYPMKIKIMKANLIGHILLKSFLLKHVVDLEVEGKIEVTG
jgi:hypothetical protein